MTRSHAIKNRSCRLAVAAAAGALLALPTAGHAATTFGSRLNHEPANSGECVAFAPNPCTIVSYIQPSDPNGDPYSGGAPVDGVTTKFRIRAFGEGNTPATVTFRLADITPNQDPDSAVATSAGIGPTVTIPPSDGVDTPIREYSGRLPVKKGNHLAIDGTNVWATVNNSGDKYSYVFGPPIVDGQGGRGSNGPQGARGELLVQADIEPDADHDGFGDETQDGCLGNAQATGACPQPDRTKPVLSGLKVSPSLFVKRARISYSLSEAAQVKFAIKRCVRPVGKRCALYKKVRRSIVDSGEAGLNTLRLNSKLNGRKLRPTRYKLVAVAVDPAGNSSDKLSKKFRIVP
jgi:hypothetical protein